MRERTKLRAGAKRNQLSRTRHTMCTQSVPEFQDDVEVTMKDERARCRVLVPISRSIQSASKCAAPLALGAQPLHVPCTVWYPR